MTVMLLESFAMAPADLIAYAKWWTWSISGSITRGVGRVPGSTALYVNSDGGTFGPANCYITNNLGPDTQRMTVGFAFMDRGSRNNTVFAWFNDTNGTGLDIRMDSNLRQFYVTRAGTTLFTFSAPYFVNRWHYIEIAFFISPTVGWVEARLDGQNVGGYYGTGTNRANANGNTRAGTINGVRFLQLGGYVYASGVVCLTTFADLVVLNGAGAANDFMGDMRVVGLPTTGPGAHTDFTPGGTAPAATNWQSVNKDPVPGDATYVQANTVGAQDTYALADLPNTIIAVKAVQVGVIARKTDAGVRFMAPLVRWAGAAGGPLDVPVPVGGIGLQGSYGYLGPQVLETRPDGQPWTVADINALEVGERIIQ